MLTTVRSAASGTNVRRDPVKLTHIQELDELAARHFRVTQAPAIAISGRYLSLVYKVASTLVSPPHELALLVIDLEGRFDATRLSCTDEDATHIYVHRLDYGDGINEHVPEDEPSHDSTTSLSQEQLREMVSGADDFFLYSTVASPSAGRACWGTIVVGDVGAGDAVAGWKGWLRVDRETTRGFSLGTSVEDALRRRSARQDVADAAGWAAESPWGKFVFHEGLDRQNPLK